MRWLVAAAPLVWACSPAAPTETRVPLGTTTAAPTTTAVAETPPPKKDIRGSLLTEAVPAKFALDGDITEWGSLAPPPPKPGKKKKDSEKEAAPEVFPNDHLALALTSDGVTLAAEVTAEMGEGFLLSLAFEQPEVPSVGYMMRGGGIMPMPCMFDENPEMDPKDLEECKAIVATHDRFTDEYVARFKGYYRVDKQGISRLTAGAWAPVAGAKVATKPRDGGGFTLEATFPQKALPRTVQAPVAQMLGTMTPLDGTKVPDLPMEQWDPLLLPEPVGFEPHADLRALVFGAAQERAVYGKPFAISYQPGDDLAVEDVNYRGSTTEVTSEPKILYAKQATMGDVEVGYAYSGTSHGGGQWVTVITLLKGKPVAHTHMTGTAIGVVERDGELHVFSQFFWPNDAGPGETHDISMMAVTKEAMFRDDAMEPISGVMGWLSASPLFNEDFSTFGVHGTTMDANGDPGAIIEIVWKYDKKKHQYVQKTRELKKAEDATMVKLLAKKKPAGDKKPPTK